MHALTYRFEDTDTITTACMAIIDDKAMQGRPTTLRRVETEANAAK